MKQVRHVVVDDDIDGDVQVEVAGKQVLDVDGKQAASVGDGSSVQHVLAGVGDTGHDQHDPLLRKGLASTWAS